MRYYLFVSNLGGDLLVDRGFMGARTFRIKNDQPRSRVLLILVVEMHMRAISEELYGLIPGFVP